MYLIFVYTDKYNAEKYKTNQWSCAINYIGHKTPARSVFTGVLVVFAMMAIMVRQCNGADTRNTNDLTDKYVSHPQCNKNITKHSIIVEEENKYITPSEMEVDWDISYHIIRHSIQHFICFKHCLFISSRVSAAYGLIHVGRLFVFYYAALHGLIHVGRLFVFCYAALHGLL